MPNKENGGMNNPTLCTYSAWILWGEDIIDVIF